MAQSRSVNPKEFFGELKRRNVYKVAIAYAVVGWLLTQVATQVLPFFEIPNWGIRMVVLIIAIGFPIALIIAWAFELTPEGLKRTEVVDRERMKASHNKAWIYVVIIAAGLSLGLFFVGRYALRNQQAGLAGITAKSIAILPFENLSEEKANAYFAEGIQDEILTKLSSVRDLKVISRTSTAKYQSKPDNLKTVANELGVATLLEGAVQKSGDKVRVNVQLIDARTDSHLWAKTNDRALELAPDSPEAHFSLAVFHYWGHRQYEPALAELQRTLDLQPNNARERQYRAWILRRQGKWEQSLSEAKSSQELDPRDANIPANIALGFATLREWDEAERYASRALAIQPDNFTAVAAQENARINGHGDIEGARRAIDAAHEHTVFPAIGPGAAPSGSAVGATAATVTGGGAVYINVIARRFADALAL